MKARAARHAIYFCIAGLLFCVLLNLLHLAQFN